MNASMKTILLVLAAAALLALAGCANTGKTASQAHVDTMGDVTENEYHVPKKPVDRAYIGAAWSRQFGPVQDPDAPEVRTKTEKSFSKMQQKFAYNAGVGLGGKSLAGPMGEAGVEGGAADRADLEGVQVIKPVSYADIPFEPNVPYVTEALRLENFVLKGDRANKAGVDVSASSVYGSGSATAQVGTEGSTATEGQGLVVAYKLHKIDMDSYEASGGNPVKLPLNQSVDFPGAKMVAKAKLVTMEPGSRQSLPRSLLWACPEARAKARNVVAAYVVDLKPLDPKRKSLTIGFPVYPEMEGCSHFDSVVYSRIDPLTDKIHRRKVTVTLVDASVDDFMQPEAFDARIILKEEAFNITPVSNKDLR